MVKFMLDPGHDMNTLGKGVAGMKEFEFNRAVVEKMIVLLKGYEGVEVLVSHDMYDGIDQSLSYRVNLANSLKVDCFCSVHANAASNPEARGIETFVDPQAPADTVNLGAVVHGELIRATGMNNRGLKRADFYVLDKTNMNAFLAECGFMTNAGDLAKLKDDGYRQTCAQAIVNGLVQHYKLKKKAVAAKHFFFITGAYTGESLLKIHEFLKTNRYWFEVSTNANMNFMFNIGAFTEGSTDEAKMESFLKTNNFAYEKKAV